MPGELETTISTVGISCEEDGGSVRWHIRAILPAVASRDVHGRGAQPVIGKPGTPINANQIESREYEAYSQIKRIKAS